MTEHEITELDRAAEGTVDATPSRGKKGEHVEHLAHDQRVARGKMARIATPLEAHAELDLSAGRPDPVALLEQQSATRVQRLVPIRYGRMLVSPFTFYRGAALPMAADLARTPSSGLRAQICGDAHLSNFGVFASPERRLVFDVNDFDETLPGPFEWDVKRLAASLVVAGRENSFSVRERQKIVAGTVAAYRDAIRAFAGQGIMTVWYAHLDIDAALASIGELLQGTRGKAAKAKKKAKAGVKTADHLLETAEKELAKARTRDSMQAFDKLTEVVDGRRRIVSDPPLIETLGELFPDETAAELDKVLRELVGAYRRTLQSDRRHLLEQFQIVDMARKVVGVGSVGTRAWILLMASGTGEPLFLQAKQAEASVLEAYAGRSRFANHGQRVVAGQHLMQAASDIFLGWQRSTGIDGVVRDYYVRQLRDWKGSAAVERMVPLGMAQYGTLCAWTLARAHARSGDRVAIAAYLGSRDRFDRAITEFAEAYADQNERDFEALKDAAAQGRVQVQSGL